METNCLPSVGLFIFLFQGKTHRRSVSCLLVQPSNAATLRVYFISRSIRWGRVGRNRRTLGNECCSFGEASRLYQWFIPLYYLKHTSVNIYRGREGSAWDILPIYLFFAIRIHISSPTDCSLAVSVNLRSSCEYMWSKLSGVYDTLDGWKVPTESALGDLPRRGNRPTWMDNSKVILDVEI